MTAADSPFRLRIPELGPGLVVRARLLAELRLRFSRPLTIVVANAGFGKTTLLAQAAVENQLEPDGVDVWFQVGDRDRDPTALLAGLAAALDRALPTRLDGGAQVHELVDAIWAAAPLDVALMIDDAHVLDGSSSWPVIAELCRRLPANGHIVIGSRTRPPLPIRSLQSRGHAVVIDEEQMSFDPSEAAAFAAIHGLAIDRVADAPVWPALAMLASTAGRDASVDFLWESILDAIPADRRQALALLVRFGRIDDGLVGVITGGRWSAASVVDGLPLIEAIGDDRRFHDLWSRALANEATPAEWKAALVTGAELLESRGEPMRAARCLHLAGADDRLILAARRFAASSISTGLSTADAGWFAEVLPLRERHGALGRYLRQLHVDALLSEHVHADMEEVRRLATEAGDDDLAALAIWRSSQIQGDIDPGALRVTDELRRLVDAGLPFARAAAGLITSHLAEARHDVEAAIGAISMFDLLDDDTRRAATGSRFLALGHPERVDTSLADVLAEGVADPIAAQAVWFRGEIDPTAAWAIAADLPAQYGRRRLPNVQVPLLGVVASVALAAGETKDARQLADTALTLARGTLPRLRLFAETADMLVRYAEHDDDGVAERLASMLRSVPLEPWPSWAYLSALAPVRALVPGTEWLDELELGPAMHTAIAAGAALAALRAHGDVVAARELPWDAPDLMRVQVPIRMLCELACAAGPDRADVAACLDRVPGAIDELRRLVDHPVEAVAKAAATMVQGEPRRPSYDLEITTLGELSVRRSDGVPVSARVCGGRVQQLLAHLLLDQAPRRSDLAATMWPDLSPKQAAANLRVTLASLLDLIEPDREPGEAWFVRSDDGRLRLASDGVRVDVHAIADDLAAARDAERKGLPSVALEHFRRALEAYGGEFLPGLDLAAVEHERLRYHSLVYNAGCRVCELLLAKGEPEDALGFVSRTAQLDPIAERARRLEIRCHLALGSSSAARTAAERLRKTLVDEGLRIDRETTQLLDQLCR